jgi:hypothetical protein
LQYADNVIRGSFMLLVLLFICSDGGASTYFLDILVVYRSASTGYWSKLILKYDGNTTMMEYDGNTTMMA